MQGLHGSYGMQPSNRLGDYLVGPTIGKGAFAKVKLGTHVATSQNVALKIFSRDQLQEKDRQKIAREVGILKRLRHPNIMKLYDTILSPTELVLCVEFAQRGELFDYLLQVGRVSEAQSRAFFQQIICAVDYCHSYGIAHRDLKPENLLLDAQLNVKLADFGLSNTMQDGVFMRTSCGTPNYAAPEVICGALYTGCEADVWSCGVILYALLCGRLPFDDDNVSALFRKIKSGQFSIPSGLSPAVADLLRRILVVNPLARATIDTIRAHPWFRTSLPRHIAVQWMEGTSVISALVDPTVARETALLLKVPIDEVADVVKGRSRETRSALDVARSGGTPNLCASFDSVFGSSAEADSSNNYSFGSSVGCSSEMEYHKARNALLVAYDILFDRRHGTVVRETIRGGYSAGGLVPSPLANPPPLAGTQTSSGTGSFSQQYARSAHSHSHERRKGSLSDSASLQESFGSVFAANRTAERPKMKITANTYNGLSPMGIRDAVCGNDSLPGKHSPAGQQGGADASPCSSFGSRAAAADSPGSQKLVSVRRGSGTFRVCDPQDLLTAAGALPGWRIGVRFDCRTAVETMAAVYDALTELAMVWRVVRPFAIQAMAQQPFPGIVAVQVYRVFVDRGSSFCYLIDITIPPSNFRNTSPLVALRLYEALRCAPGATVGAPDPSGTPTPSRTPQQATVGPETITGTD